MFPHDSWKLLFGSFIDLRKQGRVDVAQVHGSRRNALNQRNGIAQSQDILAARIAQSFISLGRAHVLLSGNCQFGNDGFHKFLGGGMGGGGLVFQRIHQGLRGRSDVGLLRLDFL